MQLDWFTFFAQFINFLILIWLMKKFLYKPVMNVMKKREDEVASRLDEAKVKNEEAEEMAKDYRDKMEQLDDRKEEWLEEAKIEAESYKKELIRQARNEVENMAAKWQESVESERAIFMEALEKQSFHKIVDTIEKIIMELADGNLEEQTLKTFFRKLEDFDQDEKERVSKTAMDGTVEILTAFELKEQDKRKAEDSIRRIFNSEINCHFKTNKDLGFGLELRSNGWKFGWNMKSYLNDLLAEMEDFIDSEINLKSETEHAEKSNK